MRQKKGMIVHVSLNVPYGVNAVKLTLDENGSVYAVGYDEKDVHGDHDIAVPTHPTKWTPNKRK